MKKAQLMQVGRGLYTLTENFNPGGQNDFGVPRGFITDLYSIPRLAWWKFAPHEYAVEPSIIHDFYLSVEVGPSKKVIDESFFYLMLEYKVPEDVARVFYTAAAFYGGREESRRVYRQRGLFNKVELGYLKNDFFGTEAQAALTRRGIVRGN